MSGTRSVPRLTCSGTSCDHDEAFLTIRTARSLVMQCPICERIERVEMTEATES